MDFTTVLDRFQDEDVLSSLTLSQSKVFVELLILAVIIDGEITDTELDALADQWSQMPFAGDDVMEDLIGEHGYAVRQQLQGIIDDEEALRSFIVDVTSRVDEENREAALRMVAVVSQTDGIAEEEVQLCHTIGRLFGFDEDQTMELIGEVYAQGVDEDE